ncbi:hypothetical protein ABLO26_13480 [Neobacillus sp. 179-J 1A1 HS]|uniref:hypothetical protein n=1 Tax=Neobacillus driksii TaxID=3035913 RepID=UPI0035BBC134
MNQTYVTLNNKSKIPQFGIGVYMVEGDANTKKVCLEALALGYKLIFTLLEKDEKLSKNIYVNNGIDYIYLINKICGPGEIHFSAGSFFVVLL